MARTYRVSLKYPDGNTMFIGMLTAEEIIQVPPPVERPAATNGSQPRPSQSDSNERMSDPQKRYLFRLLGAQGVQGKAAEDHLKTYFKVTRLADISRAAA